MRRPGPNGDDIATGAASTGVDTETTHTAVEMPRDAPTFLERTAAIGRYIVVDQLGVGGMGVVYKAYDPELDRGVALKLIRVRDGKGKNTEPSARLLREAKALARLSHPNVVAVYDAGVFDDRVYVAMELVEGHDVKQWLDISDRSVSDIVEVFVGAGRGLAAAHDAGIIHRDFKPANVMVGDDGRARVLDFGLARAATIADEPDADREVHGSSTDMDQTLTATANPPAASSTAPTSDRASLDAKLTQVGHVLGTPAYMAPEQSLGGTADALSDQFSFCVSMYYALYGERPYPGKTRTEITKAAIEGRMRPAPGDSKVPTRVHRVIARGLSHDPADRYPSMNALLADLAANPSRRRSRLIAVALAVALVAAAAIAGLARRGAQQVCTGAEDQLAGIWDDGVAAAMKTAFEATERPARYASATYDQTRRVLDDYAAAWVEMRTSACRETRVRGTQSEHLLDLRIQCLDRRLDKLRALTTLLTAPSGAPLDDAIEAAVRLPDVTGCADRDALLASVPPPADEPTRAAVAAIRRRLDEAEALLNSGEYGGGLDGVAAAAEDARAIAYSPVLAEALFLRGQLEDASGDPAAAQATLSETILIGAGAHTDRLVAEAWIALLGIVGYDQALLDEGLAMKLAVEAALGRADAGPQLEGDVLNTMALIEWRKGDFATAQRDHEHALEIRQSSEPPDRVRVADSLNNLAMLFSSQGKYETAQAYHERALAERTAVFGETHPLVADSLDNLGVQLYHQGKYDEALPYYQQALEIRVLALGPEHRNVGTSHNNIGSLFLDRGDHALAASEYEHALAIWEPVFGADHPDIALVLSNLGDLANRRGDYARALEVCRRALVIEAPSLGQDHPDLAYNLTCSGEALLGLGRAGEALEPIARALRLREEHEVDLAERGRTRFAMARALRDTGGDQARARRLASAARDDFAGAGEHMAKQRSEVDVWLARPAHD